jgi:hypothetical protein
MSSWPPKDPDDVLDYTIDWRNDEDPLLEVGETIDTSTVTVAQGSVEVDSSSDDGSIVTIWLSGGVAGEVCKVRNRIVTTEGRQYDKTVTLRIRER